MVITSRNIVSATEGGGHISHPYPCLLGSIGQKQCTWEVWTSHKTPIKDGSWCLVPNKTSSSSVGSPGSVKRRTSHEMLRCGNRQKLVILQWGSPYQRQHDERQ